MRKQVQTEDKSERVMRYSPLVWLTAEVVVGESGQNESSPTSAAVPVDGVIAEYLFGYTADTDHPGEINPTLHDGIEARVEIHNRVPTQDDPGGVDIVDVRIFTSRFVVTESGEWRKRRPAELALSPINTSALALIKLTDIKRNMQRFNTYLAEHGAGYSGRMRKAAASTPLGTGGRTKHDEQRAEWAEQVLWAMNQEHQYIKYLEATWPHQWGPNHGSDRKRVVRLRNDGWIVPGGRLAGNRLVEWRNGNPGHREATLKGISDGTN